jgi:hypothetical protein
MQALSSAQQAGRAAERGRGQRLRRHTSTQVDFSSSYDINSHCNVCFEAFNFNDETFNTHGRLEEQVLDVVDFGRRFTLGVHAKW